SMFANSYYTNKTITLSSASSKVHEWLQLQMALKQAHFNLEQNIAFIRVARQIIHETCQRGTKHRFSLENMLLESIIAALINKFCLDNLIICRKKNLTEDGSNTLLLKTVKLDMLNFSWNNSYEEGIYALAVGLSLVIGTVEV
ncbi:hypothetical protein L9F63_026957, partial [Diploptera punctata]